MKKKSIYSVYLFLWSFVFLLTCVLRTEVSASEANRDAESVVKLKIVKKNGNVVYRTGVVVGKKKDRFDRFILTSKEALKDVKKIETEIRGARPELKVKKVSDRADLAVLTIESGSNNDFTPLMVGSAAEISAGDKVRMIGYTESETEPKVKEFSVSGINLREGVKSFSVVESDRLEEYQGAPVLDEKGVVIGIVTYPDPSVKDRTDIININYIASLLSEKDYDRKEDGTFMLILLLSGGTVLLLVIAFSVFMAKRKKKMKDLSVKAAPDDHSDGKTVAMLSSAKKEAGIFENSTLGILGITGYFTGKRFSVSKHLVIGRDPKKVQIVFPDKTMGVSGVHCELRNNGGVLMLVDLGSTYGTFLQNGEKLKTSMPHVVNIGDEFYLGSKENKFQVVS